MKILNDDKGRINGDIRIEQDEVTLLEEACESLLSDIVDKDHPDVHKLRSMLQQFRSLWYSWGK
jgi:hypothetical protein